MFVFDDSDVVDYVGVGVCFVGDVEVDDVVLGRNNEEIVFVIKFDVMGEVEVLSK